MRRQAATAIRGRAVRCSSCRSCSSSLCGFDDFDGIVFVDDEIRYEPFNLAALEDRSSVPKRRRQRGCTTAHVLAVQDIRERCPRWGKEKLQRLLIEFRSDALGLHPSRATSLRSIRRTFARSLASSSNSSRGAFTLPDSSHPGPWWLQVHGRFLGCLQSGRNPALRPPPHSPKLNGRTGQPDPTKKSYTTARMPSRPWPASGANCAPGSIRTTTFGPPGARLSHPRPVP